MAGDGGSSEGQQNGLVSVKSGVTAKQPTLLPPGWWVKNCEGSFQGPPVLESNAITDYSSEEDDDVSMTLDNEQNNEYVPGELDIGPDSEGWEDTGSPDVELVTVKCLLCDQRFSQATDSINHGFNAHNFDLIKIIRDEKLDYYATIRYINLIRKRVRDGVVNPTVVSSMQVLMEGEELLRPTLEDDALLYMIEDVVDFEAD